ncbi:MAG: hypothetical protein ACI4WT_10270 [Oligosphaeraceae bacterium]
MGLPTPEELGKRIERGEMTEAEAAEIMAERARRAALPFLYPPDEDEPPPPAAPADGTPQPAARRRWLPLLWTLLALAALCALLWCL